LDDPDDDEVLACAKAANASLIVSGDSDLLRIVRFGEIEIVRDSECLKRISQL